MFRSFRERVLTLAAGPALGHVFLLSSSKLPTLRAIRELKKEQRFGKSQGLGQSAESTHRSDFLINEPPKLLQCEWRASRFRKVHHQSFSNVNGERRAFGN